MNSEAGTTTTKAKAASERHPLAVSFGAYLKAIRIKANKSQMELAFDASIDRTYVSLLERGPGQSHAALAHVVGQTAGHASIGTDRWV
jgi:DNA-binding XRE family transcriptional regulator